MRCEKPWEEDAVDVMMKLSFIWHRYNVVVFFSYAMAEAVAASTSRETVDQWCDGNFPGGPP